MIWKMITGSFDAEGGDEAMVFNRQAFRIDRVDMVYLEEN
jgi:hypothetical protein